MITIDQWMHEEISHLGIKEEFQATDYLIFIMKLMEEDPTCLCCVSKMVYLKISEHFKINLHCVERNLRTLINKIWESGDRGYLEKIAGRTLTKKPSNKQFIDILYAHYMENA